MKSWEKTLISPTTTVRSALEIINEMGSQIALVVDESGHLLGTVSDGDVRRALLGGQTLSSLVKDVMYPNPTTVRDSDDRQARLAKMRRNALHQMPVLDIRGIVVGLETVDDYLTTPERDEHVVIMAGGRVRPNNARALVARSGVAEVHARSELDESRVRGIVDAMATR